MQRPIGAGRALATCEKDEGCSHEN
jgi:hypothetical protein